MNLLRFLMYVIILFFREYNGYIIYMFISSIRLSFNERFIYIKYFFVVFRRWCVDILFIFFKRLLLLLVKKNIKKLFMLVFVM